MLSSFKNKNQFYKVLLSFFALVLFSSFSNDNSVTKVEDSHFYSFQENTVRGSEQAILTTVENHFTVLDTSIFQKDTPKNTFSFKVFALQNVVKNESLIKNISLAVSNSRILVGESNLLKIIFPFHQFW